VGFTPEYSTAVWVGYEAEQIPLTDVIINGQRYSKVFGGTVPAPIWAEFMTTVMEGIPESQFPEDPPNINEYLIPPPTQVPIVVGLDQEEALLALGDAKLNNEVLEIASLEPAGVVVRQSIEPGSTVAQGTVVTIWVSTGETPVAPLPNFRRMTIDEARDAAEEFELETGVKITFVTEKIEVQDPNRVGVIVGTNPPPGTEISEAATVVAYIGVAAPSPDG